MSPRISTTAIDSSSDASLTSAGGSGSGVSVFSVDDSSSGRFSLSAAISCCVFKSLESFRSVFVGSALIF